MAIEVHADSANPYDQFLIEIGREQGLAQAARREADGMAKSILTVLAVRGLELPYSQRVRIRANRSLELLDRWLRRAVVVDDPMDLFD